MSHLLSRRAFLSGAAGLAGGLVLARFADDARAARTRARYDDLMTDDYLGEPRIETRIEGDAVFTEGPAVDRAGNVYFTNIPASKILRWDPRQKQLTVFRENSHNANGLLFAPNGDLLACEGATHRITRTDMRSGEVAVLADSFEGVPLAPPNDLALDSQGRIYFSARPGAGAMDQKSPNAVYRLDPDGTLVRLLAAPDGTDMPNGLVTSPDDKRLYLIEAHPDADHLRNIRAFDLREDGSLANPRVLIDFYPGRSGDGMCIDAEANLYVAAGLHKTRDTSETLDTKPGIHVISPEGKLLAYVATPEDTVTNCAFGGEDLRTLYITSGRALCSVRTKIPGKPAYRPER
ncbi:MAG: SMP-30/gluconolactonase/LRE family protein [Planctomycetaceae bacterium]